MMTCKNCIHFEVCDSGRHIGEYIEDDGIYSEVVERECPTFKDASRYVELPCNVGDTVYAAITPIDEVDIIIEPCIDEWKVCGLLFKNDKWYAENSDGVFFEIGTELCKLTRDEADLVIKEC